MEEYEIVLSLIFSGVLVMLLLTALWLMVINTREMKRIIDTNLRYMPRIESEKRFEAFIGFPFSTEDMTFLTKEGITLSSRLN